MDGYVMNLYAIVDHMGEDKVSKPKGMVQVVG
jgi:hypothetical protein